MSTGISFQASMMPFNAFEKSLELQTSRPTDSPDSTPSVTGDALPPISSLPWLSAAVPSAEMPALLQQQQLYSTAVPQYSAPMVLPPGYVLVPMPQQQQQQQPQGYCYAGPGAFVPQQYQHHGPALQQLAPYGVAAASMMSPMADDGPKQLIVNFLDAEVTNFELHNAFSAIGPLEAARVIYDKLTGRSKGYGFVYFKYSRDAAAAMQCMTGHPIRGRRIKVTMATPQRPAPASETILY
jgi:hypothetical protein